MGIKNGIAALSLATALSVGCGEKYSAQEFTVPYYNCKTKDMELVIESIRSSCANTTRCTEEGEGACLLMNPIHTQPEKPGQGFVVPQPYPGYEYIYGSITAPEKNPEKLDETMKCVEKIIRGINKDTGCEIILAEDPKLIITVKDGRVIDKKVQGK